MDKKKLDMLKQPKIYLTTRTSVDWNQVAEFLDDQGVPPIPDSIRAGKDESAAVVEISARMCYMSYGRGRKDIADFINNLLDRKDGSVLEHVNFGFVITGISRSLTHELIRHRAGFAYSQRSQRYVDESGASFVIPPALVNENLNNDKVNELFNKAMENAATSYEELVNSLEESLDESLFEKKTDRRKAIRQAARSVLPNATETKLFVTANVRAWRHFIEMRSTPYADWEIRRMAIQILHLLIQESPLLFGDFKIEELPDGTSIATPLHSKV